VSKSWNVLALDGSNWQKVDFFEFQVDVDSGVVENLARRCGGFLKVLSLSGCQVSQEVRRLPQGPQPQWLSGEPGGVAASSRSSAAVAVR
jgi:hypothetical protein